MPDKGICAVCGKPNQSNWVNYTKGEVFFFCKKHFDAFMDYQFKKSKHSTAWENAKDKFERTRIKNIWLHWFLNIPRNETETFVFR